MSDIQLMEERKQRLLSFMRDQAYKPLLLDELYMVLDVPKEDLPLFTAMVDDMESKGLIIKTRKDRYGVPERMGLAVGKFQGHARGFGFVMPDNGEEDVFVPANALGGAMHGDRVVARLERGVIGDKRREGEIIRILERANKTIVGKFDKSDYFGFVIPDHARLSGDIFIPKDLINGAKKGQKVVVEITKWPEPSRNAEGKIIEVLGDADSAGVDVLSIIRAYGIPFEFPEKVVEEAKNAPKEVLPSDFEGRRDLRSLKMVTIDGEDARDLDDAVSLELLPSGLYRLGVHIADVTHYVREGSELDNEAVARGTSVYFPDRVIPMLPRELSNGICSLNANVDRLAFSVLMDIDTNGRVVSHEIFDSVIHVRERMTYTNVYKILEEDDGELKERYKDFLQDFYKMRELAQVLKSRRTRRGSVDFEFDEAKIIVDQSGKPIEIKRYKTNIANGIIEEFMLLCNEVVSEHFYWIGVPFVYRIHEDPDPEKMENLNTVLGTFGYRLKGYRDVHPKALQEIIKLIKGKPEEKAINMIMLRSLQKARYSDVHDWHFGLAADYYSHFTSPIRRYPDLIIHRIMKEQIKGKLNEKRTSHYKMLLPDIARSSSERERAAQDAERDCEDLKKAEYMKDKVGEYFDGIISNITSFGMFVELENTIEGLIRISSLEDDYYIFDERSLSLIGERTRTTHRIGDHVRVQLVKSSPESRQIDFMLMKEGEEETGVIKERPSDFISRVKHPRTDRNQEAPRWKNREERRKSEFGKKSGKGAKKGKHKGKGYNGDKADRFGKASRPVGNGVSSPVAEANKEAKPFEEKRTAASSDVVKPTYATNKDKSEKASGTIVGESGEMKETKKTKQTNAGKDARKFNGDKSTKTTINTKGTSEKKKPNESKKTSAREPLVKEAPVPETVVKGSNVNGADVKAKSPAPKKSAARKKDAAEKVIPEKKPKEAKQNTGKKKADSPEAAMENPSVKSRKASQGAKTRKAVKEAEKTEPKPALEQSGVTLPKAPGKASKPQKAKSKDENPT